MSPWASLLGSLVLTRSHYFCLLFHNSALPEIPTQTSFSLAVPLVGWWCSICKTGTQSGCSGFLSKDQQLLVLSVAGKRIVPGLVTGMPVGFQFLHLSGLFHRRAEESPASATHIPCSSSASCVMSCRYLPGGLYSVSCNSSCLLAYWWLIFILTPVMSPCFHFLTTTFLIL